MKGNQGDKFRLQHILDAISEVEGYVNQVSFDDFESNSEKRYATVKQIEIIGEASNHLTDKTKSDNPQVPWKSIKGFRNISIHEYFGVDFLLVWEIATVDLPDLKQEIQKIISKL